MSRFHVSFEIALPLVVSTSFMPILPLKAIKSKTGLLAEVRNMKFVTNSIHWIVHFGFLWPLKKE